jgi:hypothetical protein
MRTTMRSAWLLVLVMGAVSGCANAPTTRAARTDAPLARTAPPRITRLLIDFTPVASRQTSDDERFDAGVLDKTIGRVLTAAGLADLAGAAVIGVAAIEVDEFDVRATSNVVLMGRVASAAVLGATVRVRDGSGTALREFHVRADLPLNIVRNASGQDQLESLYTEFAELIVDELSGTTRKPPPRRR